MKNTNLTSVKILTNLYRKFKVKTINGDMTLQKLANRTVNLYLTDEQFRNKIESYEDLTVSGSNF